MRIMYIFRRLIKHGNARLGGGGENVNSGAGYSLFCIKFYIFRMLFSNVFASRHILRTKPLIFVVLDHSKDFDF